jgi:hypothetical protein
MNEIIPPSEPPASEPPAELPPEAHAAPAPADPAPADAEHVEPAPAAVADPPRRGGGTAIVLSVLALLGAAGSIGWQVKQQMAPPPGDSTVATLQQAVQGLTDRVVALEKRPAATPAAAATPPDLGPLEQRVAALEQRPAAAAPSAGTPAAAPTGPDAQTTARIGDVASQLDALSKRVDTLSGQVNGLTAQAKSADDTTANQLGAVSQNVQALASRVQSDDAALSGRVDGLGTRVAAVEQTTAHINALAAQGARAAQLQAAAEALQAGRKLGDVPGAPPALARYAQTPPPTEAQLRLAFPAVASAAEAAGTPVGQDPSFGQRIWANVERAITIRQGDEVIVGDPAVGVVTRARRSLDAGDLAGAVAALGTLTGKPAQAVAGWLDQARGLLAARTALADMAAHA